MPTLSVINTSGKSIGRLTLAKEIFAAPARPTLMAQAVRVYLFNQRQAPAHTKSRGEVVVSKRKIHRQKGTGRARHGSRNAPIFVGGGVAHGPTGAENFKRKMSKKMKRLSLFSALTKKLQAKDIVVVDGLEKLKPKTKIFAATLAKITDSPKIGLVLPAPISQINLAVRNLKHVDILMAHNLNTYQVLNCRTLVFTKPAIKALETHFLTSKSKQTKTQAKTK